MTLNSNVAGQLNRIIALDTEQRSDAIEKAKEYVKSYSIGEYPTEESISTSIVREHDPKIMGIGVFAIVLLLIAVFPVSASRLFHIGYLTFMEHIPHDASARVAGYATVLSAEFGLITFAFVWGVLKDGGRRWYVLGLAASVGITFLGNVVVMKPFEQVFSGETLWAFLWAWSETMAFPAISIATGIAIKNLVILRNNQQFEKDTALQQARDEWNKQVKLIEKHEDYKPRLRSALKDAIYAYNKKGKGQGERVAVMRQLQRRHWAYLVEREMDELSWDDPKAPAMLTALLAQEGANPEVVRDDLNFIQPQTTGKGYQNGVTKTDAQTTAIT